MSLTTPSSLSKTAFFSCVTSLSLPKRVTCDYPHVFLLTVRLLQQPLKCLNNKEQNSAARLQTRTNRRTHFTAILKSLHWLAVPYRIHFQILVLTFRAVRGQARMYTTYLSCLSPAAPPGASGPQNRTC